MTTWANATGEAGEAGNLNDIETRVKAALPAFAQHTWTQKTSSSALSAANLNALDSNARNIAGLVVNAEADFGFVADWNGSTGTDNTTAINNAIAALPQTVGQPRGGTILLPPGAGKVGQLVANSTQNVTIRGATSNSANDPALTGSAASALVYTGAGSGSVIDARSTQAFSMAGLAVAYTSASYTGTVLDLSHDGSGSDSQQTDLYGVALGGASASATNAHALVSLKQAIFFRSYNSYYGRAVDAIRMREDNAGSTLYSNSHTIMANQFARHQHSIMNAGEGVLVFGNGFEGTGGTLQNAYFDDIPDANNAIIGNLTWWANWMGDAFSAIPNYWLDFGNCEVRHLDYAANLMSQKKLMIFRKGGRGNSIRTGGAGSDTDHLIDIGTVQHHGLTINSIDASGGPTSLDAIKNRSAGHLGKAITGNRWVIGSVSFDELQMKGGRIGSPLTAPVPTANTPHANAGTSATCTIASKSSDMALEITLTTGSGAMGVGVANFATFLWSSAYDNVFTPAPNVGGLSAKNENAANAYANFYLNGDSITGFQLGVRAAITLPINTTYVFNVHVLQ